MIEHRRIYSYLLAHGLITEQDLVEGEVSVLDAARRNSNFIIRSSNGPAYLFKQGTDEGKAATLANEAFVYNIFGKRRFARSELSLAPFLRRRRAVARAATE